MNNEDKIILDLCGGTGAWSRPYKEGGFPIILITLPEYDILQAYTDDVSIHFPHKIMPETIVPFASIYGILAAPPCTMFSDARTHAKLPRDLRGGYEVVKACLRIIEECMYQTISDQQKYAPLKFWALENPWWGRLKWFLGKPAFVFDPYEFGDAYQKKTALWGYFNEPKKSPIELSKEQKDKAKTNSQKLPTNFELKGVNNQEYWKDTKNRSALRAITPTGFAEAFFKANK